MSSMRSRTWSFRTRQPTSIEPYAYLRITGLMECAKHAIVEKDENGHILGYCNLKYDKTHSAMSKILRDAEIFKGYPSFEVYENCIEYGQKPQQGPQQGKRTDPENCIEYGIKPKQGKRSDLSKRTNIPTLKFKKE